DEVTLYVTSHGQLNRFGNLEGTQLGEMLLPIVKKYQNIKNLKITSCHSADAVDLNSVSEHCQQTITKEGLTTSLTQKTSEFFNANNIHMAVFGYRGAHHEKRKNREKRSFTEIDGQIFCASKARVKFFDGKMIAGPKDPQASNAEILFE